MLRRLSVRGKILATLAIPVVVLVIAAVIIAGQSISTAVTGGQSKAIAEATKSHDALMTALQNEYTVTLDNATTGAKGTAAITKARAATDTALSGYLGEAEHIDLGVYADDVAASWDTAAADLRNIDSSRASVDGALASAASISPLPVIHTTYGSMVDAQASFYETLTSSLTDRDLARSFQLYTETFALRSAYANEVRVATPLLETGRGATISDADATSGVAALQATNSDVESVTQSLDQLQLSTIEVPTFSVTQSIARAAILAGRADRATQASLDAWPQDTATFSAALVDMQAKVRLHVTDAATTASADAWTQAWITLAAVIVAIILSVLLALLIARQVTRPLSMLTAAAGRVRDELPSIVAQSATPGEMPDTVIEPIEVESHDEIGQLAEAFNEVNDTTVSVAREQAALRGSIAEMFVNVARRDHALLNRQLSFLDDLERAEEDPTTLSNLFRLDHLATRMRRNSESLLVLAGIDSGRRVREAMPLSDVIRTASSEIEAYDRVDLTLMDDPTMLGHHALNAAHLLAELLENATMFSDPSSTVEVSTQVDRYYVSVLVRDHGLGMTPEELEAANKKLASRSASDVVGNQRLGLFVVGRIADRLGAHVTFDTAEGGGTVVTTAFPRGLFIGMEEHVETGSGALPAVAAPAGSEPVDAEPVDLAALTDGETAAGIPRRKARTAAPSGAAPSVGLRGELVEDEIILPAIETPLDQGAGLVEATDRETWQPLQIADEGAESGFAVRRGEGAGGLPSRTPSQAPAVDLEGPQVAAPLDSEKRSAMFSSFRARDALVPEQSSEEEAVAPPTGPAPIVVPGLVPDGEDVTPPAPVDGSYEPQAVLDEPAAESLWAPPAEPASDAGASATASEAPITFLTEPEVGPSVEQSGADEDVPTVSAVEQTAVEPVPGEHEPATPEAAPVEPAAWGLDFVPGGVPQEPATAVVDAEADTDLAEPGAQAVPVAPPRRLPRHAAPGDLERLARQLEEEPEGALQGDEPAPAGPLDEPVAAGAAEQPDLEAPAQPAAQEWYVPGLQDDDEPEPTAAADVPEQPSATAEDALPEAFDAEPTTVPAVEQDLDASVPEGAVPDGSPAAGAAAQQSSDAPTADGLAGAPEAPAAAGSPVPDGVASGMVPAGAGTTAVPAFADVIADVPSAEEKEKPRKKGLFGRIFGGGRGKGASAETEQASAAAPQAPGDVPPVAAAPPAPVTEPSTFAPQPFEPAPVSFAPQAPAEAPPSFAAPAADGYLSEPEDQAPAAPFVPEPEAPAVDEAAFPVAPSSFGPDGEPTMTAYAQAYPDASAEAALQQASAEDAWTPQPAFEPAPWSPEAPGGLAPRRGDEAAPADQPAEASWTPTGPGEGAGVSGSMSPELAAMLASRADIQEQALSELSQLSTYRPAAVQDQPAGGLVRRQRTEVAAPADDPTSQKISRDATLLRSRLSAFQSGTSRGRQEGTGAEDGAPDVSPDPDSTPSSAVRPR